MAKCRSIDYSCVARWIGQCPFNTIVCQQMCQENRTQVCFTVTCIKRLALDCLEVIGVVGWRNKRRRCWRIEAMVTLMSKNSGEILETKRCSCGQSCGNFSASRTCRGKCEKEFSNNTMKEVVTAHALRGGWDIAILTWLSVTECVQKTGDGFVSLPRGLRDWRWIAWSWLVSLAGETSIGDVGG